MLTGDNGILTKASDAKEKTQKAQAEEEVRLAVLASIGTDGKIDPGDLKDNLNKIKGIETIREDIEIDANGYIVKVNGYEFTITEDGDVTFEGGSYEEGGSSQTPTEPEKVALTGIEVPEGKEEITIGIGEEASIEINATMVPSNADDKLKYSSSDETKATVDENGKVIGIAEGEVTITISGETATTVTEEIKVTVKEGLVTVSQIVNSKASYYGKQVTNYKASESDTNVYRIFYVDEAGDFGEANTVYLKADYSGSYNLNSYASYDAINTKVKEMNPDWATARGTATWNTNEKAAAYLCSPVFTNGEGTVQNSTLPWASYYNAEYANYVIGGPSAEMYVKSYNQVPHTPDNEFSAEYSATSSPGYIYKVNGTAQNSGYSTNDDTLDYSATYNSMYCGKTTNGTGSKTGYWWLASPSASGSAYVCSVGGTGAGLGYNYSSNGSGLAPLVSLKSNFQIQVAE